MLNVYQLEQQIAEQMRAAQIPGLALAIVKDGQMIYAHGFGVTSVEDSGLPVTPQTLFRIGSITKPFTGTAVMRLAEEGKLDIDRPVKDYVPWLTFSQEGAADRVTLRLLMGHRSGLVTDAEHFGRRDPEALEAHIRNDLPLYRFIAPPGKLWFYSNPGLNLVGYVAEVASSQRYTDLMQTFVFEPLQMHRTTFDPTVAMTYPLAQSHTLNEDGTLSVEHRFADNIAHYPGGFLMSTALDLANFAIMQMNQGRFDDTQVLSAASVAEMQTPQANLYTTNDSGYGLTFGIETYKSQRVVGHGGAISSFGSQLSMIPAAGVAVVLLFNRTSAQFSPDALVNSIFDQLLNLPEQTPALQPVEPDSTLWPLYTGSYLGPYSGLAVIQVENNQPILDLNGERIPLKALRNDLYFGQRSGSETPVSVGFIPEEAGPVQYLIVDGSPCQRVERDETFVPDPEVWSAYAGIYEGIGKVQVIVRDGQLFLYPHLLGKEMRAVPLDNMHFACDWCSFEFLPNENGKPALKLADTWTLTKV